MGELKIFLKYIFNPSGLIEGLLNELKKLFEAKRLASILILVGIYFLIVFPTPKNRYYSVVCFIIALLLQLRIVYIGGEHKSWNRKKLGILSKKELSRKEWSSENGETDPKVEVKEK